MAAALLLAGLCQLGCDGWTWGENRPRPPSDGAPLTLKVLGKTECAPPGAKPSPDTDSPRAQRTLGVEVELTGWEPTGVPANYYYAHLEDSQGRRYPAEDTCEPALVGPPLGPGERARGVLTFTIPAVGSGYTLVYAPRLVASSDPDEARVEVTLGDRD